MAPLFHVPICEYYPARLASLLDIALRRSKETRDCRCEDIDQVLLCFLSAFSSSVRQKYFLLK